MEEAAMQGPEDEGVAPHHAVRVDEQAPARPYGGKAMLRLLEHLNAQGLTSLAQAAAAAAVTDEVKADAVAHAEAIGALSAPPQGDDRPSRARGSRRSATTRAGAADDVTSAAVPAAEESASEYATVANSLAGPP